MKEKLAAIRKRTADLQSAALGISTDCDALLTEIDAQAPTVNDLDAKVERLRTVDAQLAAASQDLQASQQRKESIEQAIADLKAKL